MTATDTRGEHAVWPSADLSPGEMVGVSAAGLPVVVLRTHAGTVLAFVDRCVHQGARISHGRLQALTDGSTPGDYRSVADRPIVKCPWHGYEYDVQTGCALFDRRRGLRRVTVSEVDEQIVVRV